MRRATKVNEPITTAIVNRNKLKVASSLIAPHYNFLQEASSEWLVDRQSTPLLLRSSRWGPRSRLWCWPHYEKLRTLKNRAARLSQPLCPRDTVRASGCGSRRR
jgi:hypothetical protein